MTDNNDNGSQNEPQDSHRIIGQQAAPARWLGIAAGLLIASLFALFALEDPYPYVVFPIAGLGIVFGAALTKRGAYTPSISAVKPNIGTLVPVAAIIVFLFFGSVIVRRTYDVAWLPVAAGVLVGLVVYLLNEHIRRVQTSRSTNGQDPGMAD